MKSILFVRPEGGIIEFANPAPRREPAAEQIVFRRSDGSAIVFFRKYNPYHDRLGRFASADGAGGAAFRPAKTQAEAEQYARQELGFWEVDFGDHLDMETINHINEQIHAVQEKYPELKGAVQSLRTAKLEEGTYAQTRITGDGIIKLEFSSADYEKGLSAVARKYQQGVMGGIFPKGVDERSIIWHEYGHVLAAYVCKKWVSPERNFFEKGSAESKEFSQMRRERVVEKIWLEKAAQRLRISTKNLSAAISVYAKGDDAETFAEAFSEANCSASPRWEALAVMRASGYDRE